MLIDEVEIVVTAGKGGDGSVTFRREKFIPKGGPWGGNGGKGGDVYLQAVSDIGALGKFRNQKIWKAKDGEPGGAANKSGKNARDMILDIPVGTVITNSGNNDSLEFKKIGEKIRIAQGGKGGRGNTAFTTSTRQTPRFAEKGRIGEQKKLLLELKLIADIGLVGLPNTGKTSLLNELTNSSAKVGNYFFTTLEPNLGVLENLVIADIPGLIEGASEGKGLGFRFLRHITRTKIVVFCISSDTVDITSEYKLIRRELGIYDKALLQKPEIVILTKSDLVSENEQIRKIKIFKKFKKKAYPVSIYHWDQFQFLRKILLSFKIIY